MPSPEFIKLVNSIPSPPKDSKNGHFKNEYASLGSVTDTVKKVLNPAGYMISQNFDDDVLVTACFGPDGLELTSRLKLPSGGPSGINVFQVLGQAITYCRRYALVSMFCLNAGDVDDDAELATWYAQQQKDDAVDMSPKIKTAIKSEVSGIL